MLGEADLQLWLHFGVAVQVADADLATVVV